MKIEQLDRRLLEKILVSILLVSLGIHALSLLLGEFVFTDWRLVQVPLHSSVETIGALIAFAVAFLLVGLEERNEGTSYNLRIAAALVGMGFFDSFHAVVQAEPTFVWFHSLSTLAGGILFSLVWLPSSVPERLTPIWPYWSALGCVVLASLSQLYPTRIPNMLRAGEFSATAVAMNLTGGVLLIVASAKLLMTFRSEGKVDDLLFSLHCLLFGAAGIMFEQSAIWDFSWWGWHILRLFAYCAALVFAVDTVIRDQRSIREYKHSLESQIRERTRELEATLREKETLLKEIHHRVKNNMQLISSMLSLQSARVDDAPVREMFEESLNRIQSMALVHDLLYQSDDLSELDFRNYVGRLSNHLEETLVPSERDITIRTDVDSVQLSVDTTVRCGLILNELLTNSIQHGFDEGESGRVDVSFDGSNGKYSLTVKDNGSGFDVDELSEGRESLGIGLVESLVQTDLDGNLSVTNNGGTTVTVTFEEAGIKK